jgi:hypothetical protein
MNQRKEKKVFERERENLHQNLRKITRLLLYMIQVGVAKNMEGFS